MENRNGYWNGKHKAWTIPDDCSDGYITDNENDSVLGRSNNETTMVMLMSANNADEQKWKRGPALTDLNGSDGQGWFKIQNPSTGFFLTLLATGQLKVKGV